MSNVMPTILAVLHVAAAFSIAVQQTGTIAICVNSFIRAIIAKPHHVDKYMYQA